MKENYMPSSKEFEKAKGMIDKKEGKMSRMREEAIGNIGNYLFRDLKEGRFNLKIYGSTGKIDAKNLGKEQYRGKSAHLVGKIGDRKVSIEVVGKSYIYAPHIEGTINGESIDKELAAELFNKYCDVAKLQNDEIFKDRAEGEIFWEEREEDRQRKEKNPEYQKKALEKKEKERLEQFEFKEKKNKEKELEKKRIADERGKYSDIL